MASGAPFKILVTRSETLLHFRVVGFDATDLQAQVKSAFYIDAHTLVFLAHRTHGWLGTLVGIPHAGRTHVLIQITAQLLQLFHVTLVNTHIRINLARAALHASRRVLCHGTITALCAGCSRGHLEGFGVQLLAVICLRLASVQVL